jgi:outer membrane receptor for ferrienterochelin and colicins
MKRPALLLILAIAWLGTSPGAAGFTATDQADEAQFLFLRGNRAYQERRYEDALASWYQSNRLVPNRNVQFNIARCVQRLGRYDEAFRAWSTLLAQSLPADEAKSANAALAELRPHLALVDIRSTPPGATIYAGRKDLGALGVTPKVLALAPGATTILLERAGYRPEKLQIDLVRGQTRELVASMEMIRGRVVIRRIPESAEIRLDLLDGELVRRGPGPFDTVPGPAILFVSAPGHQTQRVAITVVPDDTVVSDVLLTPAVPPSGTLVVRANTTGALIRIDGKEAGFTPAVIERILIGSHELEISEEGRQPYRTPVEIRRDERTFVDARLGRADPEITAATKSAVGSEDAPASITVVTADEIAAMGYTSLTRALTAVRGTFTSNDRSYESVGFRGFSPPGDYTNRVLVLVDGHPINDVVTGQGYVGYDFDVDLANVARIEVVRGPGSVLYGTGALFGVINVVTRRPTDGAHGAVNTTLGSMSLASGRATASMRRGAAEIMVSAAALDFAGQRRYTWDPADNQGIPAVVLEGDGERARHADLLARVGPLALRAGYNDRRKDVPTGAFATDPVNGTYLYDHRAYADLSLEQGIRGGRLALRAAYDASWYHGRFAMFDPATTAEETLRSQWLTGEARLELPELKRQRLTLGGEIVEQLTLTTAQPTGEAIPRDRIVSAYLVDHVRLHARLHLDLGLRADRYTRSFGNVLNPRLALVGKPYARGNTKLLVGRSFRAPSPNERAVSETGELLPETIWSAEIEHSHAVSDDLRVLAAVFANDLANLIVVNQLSVDAVFVNMTEHVRGIGAEGELRWEPGGGTLLAIAAAYQQVRVHGASGDTPFVNSPSVLVQGRAMVPLVGPILRLGTEIVLDSGRHFRADNALMSASPDNRLDDVILCNLTLSGELRSAHLRYFAGLLNLFDVHDARTGFPTSADYRPRTVPRLGRTLRAGLTWSF